MKCKGHATQSDPHMDLGRALDSQWYQTEKVYSTQGWKSANTMRMVRGKVEKTIRRDGCMSVRQKDNKTLIVLKNNVDSLKLRKKYN